MLQNFALDPGVFGNRLIRLQLLQLRLLGYVYPADAFFKVFHFVRGLISTVILFILVAAQLYGIWLNYDNFNISFQMFGGFVTFINIVTRTFVFYMCNKEYKSLITNVEIGSKNALVTGLPAEMKIFNQYGKYIAVFTYSLWILVVIASSYLFFEATYFLKFHYDDWVLQGSGAIWQSNYCTWRKMFALICFLHVFLVAVTNGTTSTRLPFLYVFYPVQNIGSNYKFAFILPFGALIVTVTALIGWHSFNASLMQYISFRLDIIKYKVSNMQEYVDFLLRESDLSVDSQKFIERTNRIRRFVFVSCVKDYNDIKSFVKEYENVTSATVFVESFTISVLLCVILYFISKDISAGYGIYELYCIFIIQILWVYYGHGNEILTKSNEITNAIYFQNWYDLPVSMQKDTLLFMTATMEPITLKAVFIYMNNESLVKILKTSYSYLMLLRSLE